MVSGIWCLFELSFQRGRVQQANPLRLGNDSLEKRDQHGAQGHMVFRDNFLWFKMSGQWVGEQKKRRKRRLQGQGRIRLYTALQVSC